jgi:hypothetical protein
VEEQAILTFLRVCSESLDELKKRAILTFLRDCSESLDELATAEDLNAGMTAWGITQAM